MSNCKKYKSKGIWYVVGIIIVLIGLFIWSKLIPKPTPKIINDPETLSGIQTGDAPWDPELSHLRERLKTLGLPALGVEGTALHIHQHLDIFIAGKSVSVPANIGNNKIAFFISDIHTHDTTGIIHIESPTIQKFTLGQFFDIWGVDFTSQNIGGYKNQNDKTLKVFVNGNLYEGDPRQLGLESHQEIVVTYGTDKELPNPIPATYAFPTGY